MRQASGGSGIARVRSTISFPYFSLEECAELAKTVHRVFGGTAELDQLAGSLKTSPASGGFRLKVAASKLFGLIETGAREVVLTDSGAKVVDGDRESIVSAFLGVPLFGELFDKLKSRSLPDEQGLEKLIKSLGVTPKQVTKARITFKKSASYAGFFEISADRLVKPSFKASNLVEYDNWNEVGEQPRLSTQRDDRDTTVNAGVSVPEIAKHPLMLGMLGALPDLGGDFSQEDRDAWVEAMKINLQLIYGKGHKRTSAGNKALTPDSAGRV